jgi:uncharacterized protein with GYD domain
MFQFSLTSETWSKMTSDPEAYRGEIVRRVVERYGGRVKDIWYTSGTYDGFLICELPNRETAAAISIAYSTTGMCKDIQTLMLLTVDEVQRAVMKASGQDNSAG